MSVAMPDQPDVSTPMLDSHLDELRELHKLRELMGDILEHLDKSPDSAVRHGSVLHHAVRAASKTCPSRRPVDPRLMHF
ncbi:MAG TPA: hypothetical protein VJ998_10095 [Pseudomonadales bacterium]|nr:hypothetical protein [Pseudomonadales bacterium]